MPQKNSVQNNRFLAAGTFGCVYAPPVKCGQNTDDTVGKIFVKGRSAHHNQRDFEEELNANDLVREINTDGNFTLTDQGDCYISGNALTEDEKASCAATSKDSAARSRTSQSLNTDEIPQIIYKKSGVPLHDIQKKKVPLSRFIVHFQNIMEGLVRLNETEYAHLDIKPANILYNPQTDRANLIDFGHFGPEDKLYADSQTHLLMLGHHYPYYPPEFKVLFMFAMGMPDDDIDMRIFEKTLSVYHLTLEEELEMRGCTGLDLSLTSNSRLNVLYTRKTNKQNAEIIHDVEKSIHHLDDEVAKKYDSVFKLFHHSTRLAQIKQFLSRIKDELMFDTFAYSRIKLAAMEKLFLNERFGAKIDIYSVGITLMEVIYDYLMPVLFRDNVNSATPISNEMHYIIIEILYIISGMVHPDPFMRLNAMETLGLYSKLVHAIQTRNVNSRKHVAQKNR